jgi:hypothetical protein
MISHAQLRPAAVLAFVSALSLGGCSVFAPKPPECQSIEVVRPRLEMANETATKMPDYVPMQYRILWWLPNRLLDAVDVAKASIGLGPGVGIEVYVTKAIWVSYLNYRSWRFGFDGRTLGFYEDGQYRRWRINDWHLAEWHGKDAAACRIPKLALKNFRPHEAPLIDGKAAVREIEKNLFDIGASLHFLVGADALVRPFEVLDLVVGLWGDDPAEDDYGLRYYPLWDYQPQSSIVDIFVNALDEMNEADLENTLSKELWRKSSIRAQGDTSGAPSARDGGFVSIDGIRIYPGDFRDGDGNLDVQIRCEGATLRWGVPAEFEYNLTMLNRYRRSMHDYHLTLRLEDSHWVITDISTGTRYID